MREGRRREDEGIELDLYGLYEMVRYNGSFNTFNEPIEWKKEKVDQFWRNI